MADIRSHRDLIAWQKTVELTVDLYEVTIPFPDSEKYGLVSQLRRAAVSVPSNIAEGYGRGTTQDYIRFLRNARGSLYEIDTQVHLATRLGMLAPEPAQRLDVLVAECSRILAGLIRSLEDRMNHVSQ
jgi:four helix bundle protein